MSYVSVTLCSSLNNAKCVCIIARWLKAPPKENEDKAEASLEGEEGEEEEEDSQSE